MGSFWKRILNNRIGKRVFSVSASIFSPEIRKCEEEIVARREKKRIVEYDKLSEI